MYNDERRRFLGIGGAVVAAGALGGIARAVQAAEQAEHMEHASVLRSQKGVDAFVVDAAQEGICATCAYWGGIRRVAEDGKAVLCESLGWCNNPESHHYQSKTTPVTGPMKSWKKWDAL